MKILMVCLGNICRSPLAEGLLAQKLSPQHTVDSCGTGDWHIGSLPDHRSIAVAKKYGLDISAQRGRQIRTEDFMDFDLILVMDESNLQDVKKLASSDEFRKKVHLILDYANLPGKEVPDPYYGQEEGFEYVYKLLDQATQNIANQIEA